MNLYLFSIFILICLIFSIIEISERRNFIVLHVILTTFYILLIATRSVKGTPDTYAYVDDFKSVSTSYLYSPDNVNTANRFEYGYTLISQIFKMLFGNNIVLFFGFIAFINLALVSFYGNKIIKYKISDRQSYSISPHVQDKYSKHDQNILFAPFISLYVSYFGFMYSGIVLRQSLAFSIFLIAFYLLINQRYVWGLLVLAISFFFHNMAIFSIPILIFIFTKFTFKKATYYIFLSILLLLYVFKFFNVFAIMISDFMLRTFYTGFYTISSEKLLHYLGNTSDKFGSYSISIAANIIFSFIAINLIDNTDRFQHKLLQINLFAISALSLTSGILAVSRAIDYYSIFNVLLFYLVLVNGKTAKLKLVYLCIIIISNSILFYRLGFT